MGAVDLLSIGEGLLVLGHFGPHHRAVSVQWLPKKCDGEDFRESEA